MVCSPTRVSQLFTGRSEGGVHIVELDNSSSRFKNHTPTKNGRKGKKKKKRGLGSKGTKCVLKCLNRTKLYTVPLVCGNIVKLNGEE